MMSQSEVDRIMAMSDAEVLADARSKGLDPEEIAARHRASFERLVAMVPDRENLADRLASKKAGARGHPSLDNEVNLGWVTEQERDLIVATLRRT
jgi:hypothetical protein